MATSQPVPRPVVTIIGTAELRICMSMGVHEFCQFCTCLRYTAAEFLDLDACYGDQDEERRRLFEQKVTFKMPILKTDYESAWPIEVYMAQYLKRRMYTCKVRPSVNGRPVRKMGPRRDFEVVGAPKNETRKSDYYVRQEERLATLSGFPRPSVPTAQPYVLLPSLSSVVRRSGRSRANVNASTSTATGEGVSGPSLPRSPQTEKGSSDVREFLRHLKPNLESFCADFIEAGIVTASDVKALLSWPEEDRNKFYMQEFGRKMSCFQLGALQIGSIRHAHSA